MIKDKFKSELSQILNMAKESSRGAIIAGAAAGLGVLALLLLTQAKPPPGTPSVEIVNIGVQ